VFIISPIFDFQVFEKAMGTGLRKANLSYRKSKSCLIKMQRLADLGGQANMNTAERASEPWWGDSKGFLPAQKSNGKPVIPSLLIFTPTTDPFGFLANHPTRDFSP